MAYETVFQRYELKYLLTREQRQAVLRAMEPYMRPDPHGKTTICNLYFDTADYRLIRRSIDSPIYKEKLRIRSYGPVAPESTVFVEPKKKYQKLVSKRRVAMAEKKVMDWLVNVGYSATNQIAREIDYCLHHYPSLYPTAYLCYNREAYFAQKGDLRITFDDTILCRQEELSLLAKAYGEPLLPPDITLMEIKCTGGLPLWMTHTLSREHLYRTSFSKYGTAYQTLIRPSRQRED